jgi:uncharacterized protein (DUF433 family)
MDENVVSVNRDILGGTPCFSGTRVPVASLFDHLKQGVTVDEFLDDFPTVRREQVDALLDQSKVSAERHAVGSNA